MHDRFGDAVTVVVACDDDASRARVVEALAGERDVAVRAAVATGTVATTVFRLRPDVLVLVTPRLRHVDVARLRAIGRDRRDVVPAVVLLVDDPVLDAGAAARAGVSAVRSAGTDPAALVSAVRGVGGSPGPGRTAPCARPVATAVLTTARVVPARR